jgi:hypothetical protein
MGFTAGSTARVGGSPKTVVGRANSSRLVRKVAASIAICGARCPIQCRLSCKLNHDPRRNAATDEEEMSEDIDRVDVYRIEAVSGGFEAQMLYPCGAIEREEWFPLNPDGYWSDPEGFSFGLISRRHVFATEADAADAIRRAKAINT